MSLPIPTTSIVWRCESLKPIGNHAPAVVWKTVCFDSVTGFQFARCNGQCAGEHGNIIIVDFCQNNVIRLSQSLLSVRPISTLMYKNKIILTVWRGLVWHIIFAALYRQISINIGLFFVTNKTKIHRLNS